MYRVLVLVVNSMETSEFIGWRWTLACTVDNQGSASVEARSLFDHGYSPLPGRYYRVLATHVEKVS